MLMLHTVQEVVMQHVLLPIRVLMLPTQVGQEMAGVIVQTM